MQNNKDNQYFKIEQKQMIFLSKEKEKKVIKSNNIFHS